MSLIFWKPEQRKTNTTEQGAIAVSEADPLPVGLYYDEGMVDTGHPLPVKDQSEAGFIKGIYFESDAYLVPGIGTGAAYAALDQFGTEFIIPNVPKHWMLTQIDFIDPDDEGAAMYVWLARSTLGVTSSDNGALVIPDDRLQMALGDPIAISTYGDANTGQIGTKPNIDRLMYTPNGLYVQLQSGGTPNIAAGALPSIRVKGLR